MNRIELRPQIGQDRGTLEGWLLTSSHYDVCDEPGVTAVTQSCDPDHTSITSLCLLQEAME